MDTLVQDLRYSLRALRHAPLFAAVVTLTLSLGIAANLVVFSVVHSVLLQPLPVRDPGSLYQIRPQAWTLGRLLTTSYPAFEDFRERNATFTDMAAVYAYSSAVLRAANGSAVEVHGSGVTGNYFDLLGVSAQLGRFFTPADIRGPGSAPYIILSDAAWRKYFDGDPTIIGATVTLNRHPFAVLGVASPEFHGTEKFAWPDYWIPAVNEAEVDGWNYLHDRTSRVTVLGRLKPGTSVAQAEADLDAVAAALAREHPLTDNGARMRLVHPGLMGDDADLIRAFLYGVMTLAALVLVAAGANLATLFAARTADRGRELAMRVALGAGRARIVRQLLTEAVVVTTIATVAGLAGTTALTQALNQLQLGGTHVVITVGASVYLVALGLGLACAAVFGVIPARLALRNDPMQLVKADGAPATGLRRYALRDVLLGVQVAICAVLVTASFVAARGMIRTLEAPLGFQSHGAMLVDINYAQEDLPAEAVAARERALLEATRRLPGVRDVAAASDAQMIGWMRGVPVYAPGTVEFTPQAALLGAYAYVVTPGYLAAAGTRLYAGRDLRWDDGPAAPRVALVNETFARRLWGNQPPIGQYFVMWGKLTRVAGVVENGKYHDLAETPQPAVYVPLAQNGARSLVLVVRMRQTAPDTGLWLQRRLAKIEPGLPLRVQSWNEALSGVMFPGEAAAVGVGVMGAFAALLAATGIFGMASYAVTFRTKELGIRASLGAGKPQLIAAALGRPLVLLGGGSLAGLLGGVGSNALLRHVVYQANASDPVVIGAVVVSMMLIGLLATAVPLRRVCRLDPSTLMRQT